MTFSYSPTLARPLDRVRFMLGDVIDAGHLLENQEIVAILSVQPSESLAAALIADNLARRFATMADVSIGATSVSHRGRATEFAAMADRLRRDGGDGSGAVTVAGMVVGGISYAAAEDLASDSDRVQPSFSLGQDDRQDSEDRDPQEGT